MKFFRIEADKLAHIKKNTRLSFRYYFYIFVFSNTIEVTVLPDWPPNWNVGVGNTVFNLNNGEKKALSSSSVQLQDVIKKRLGDPSETGFKRSNKLCRYCKRISLEWSWCKLIASYVPLSMQTSKVFFMFVSRLRISQIWKREKHNVIMQWYLIRGNLLTSKGNQPFLDW